MVYTLSHNRWLEQETDRIFNFGKVIPCSDRFCLARQ